MPMRKPTKALLSIVQQNGLIPIDEISSGEALDAEGTVTAEALQRRFVKFDPSGQHPPMILTLHQAPDQPVFDVVQTECERYERVCAVAVKNPYHPPPNSSILYVSVSLGHTGRSWISNREFVVHQEDDPIWSIIAYSWMENDWFIELVS